MDNRIEALPYPNIFQVFLSDGTNQIATQNFVPGQRVYDESLILDNNVEYRTWNPHRSKIAAAIRNHIPPPIILPNERVLYLGAASGTTVSHVSDIVGAKGRVYAVEFAPRSIKDMLSM